MIDLDFDLVVDDLTLGLDRSSRAVRLALKRAVRKTLMAVRTYLLRMASKSSGVSQKKLKSYKRVSLKVDGSQGEVWLGFNPLPLHEAGRVSWSRRGIGVRVGGRTYAGAFYKAVYGSEKKAWIRSARNRQEGHATYHPQRKYKSFGSGGSTPSHGRFPVELLGISMEDAAEEADRRLEQFARDRFRKIFEHELEYALDNEHR